MAKNWGLKVSDLITRARIICNDNRADVGLRASDAELIGWLNDGLAELQRLVPGLFAVSATHTCVAGYIQDITFDRAASILEIVGVPVCDALTLTQFNPNWMNDTPGPAANWMKVDAQPLRFDLHPPSPVGQTLSVRYSQVPATLVNLTDVVPVIESYGPALVDYIVGRAETKDDEYVNSGRAKAMSDSFVAKVKGTS